MVRVLAAALALLGLAVMLGWLARIAPLTDVSPGLPGMAFSAALCFALIGTALMLHRPLAPGVQPSLAGSVCAALALALALANLLQITGVGPLGINLPALHAWNWTRNPTPGQMPLSTTLCFILGAAATLMLRLRQRSRVAAIGRVLAVLPFGIGQLTVCSYAMKLEPLYSWYPMSQMALHSAVGMMLLGTALWLAWSGPQQAYREEREIVAVGTTALVIVALLSALTGIWVLRTQGTETLNNNLQTMQRERADLLVLALDQGSARAVAVSAQPSLQRAIRLLAARPGDRAGVAGLEREFAGIRQFGFESMALLGADGSLLAAVGEPGTATDPEVPVRVSQPGRTSLTWHSGLRLRSRIEIRDAVGKTGELVLEHAMPVLQNMLTSTAGLGDSGVVALCGLGDAGPACLWRRGAGLPELKQDLGGDERRLIRLGLDGVAGIDHVAGGQGKADMAAYGPAGATGVAFLVQINAAELYAPIRHGLLWGFVLVGLLVIAAAIWLRRRVSALARRLAFTESRYKSVVESLNEGLVSQDAAGRVLATNAAATRILGLDNEVLHGRRPPPPGYRTIHEDGSDWPAEDHPAARTLRSGTTETGVVMGLVRAHGEPRWISVNTAPSGGAMPGDERGVIVSLTDITERREAEQRARQLDQRFRLIVDSVADYAIFMLDVDGRIVSWNRGAMWVKGYRAEEIIGSHFSVFYPEEERAKDKPAQDLETARSMGRFEDESWRVRKSGRRYWSNVVISAVRDEQGRLLGFAEVSRDLSERRGTEQRLARANYLREAILEAAPLSIIATDPEGVITSFNPAAERMLWYKAEELVGKARLGLIHDAQEVEARAHDLSADLGRDIEPGFEVFVHKSRFDIVEENEWSYVRKDGSRFPVNLAVSALRDERGEINGFLGIAYDITERKRRDEYTRHIAHHDFLTGLPNRVLLQDRMRMAIQRAQRERSTVAVMMIDLDHFKRVNDSLGHHVGDQLLKTVATRVLACVRGSDTVARMGGDEFAVVLGEVGDDGGIQRVAAAIIERVAAPIEVDGHELFVTPSIGISRYPDDGEDLQALLMNADSAMYRAKAEGRAAYRLFSRDMEIAARNKMSLEVAMRLALRNGEFRVHYQPQFSVRSGEVVGMEALLRWHHPLRGPQSPVDFIPVAEESGLIVEIGEWVLATACREARLLQQRSGRPLRVAVNLSPRQFRQANLLELIRHTLEESGLAPGSLELEITEGALLAHTPEIVERLRQLRALGVSIAVDDFGVGFSSLSYITRFPISTLKIDRVFVSQLPDSASDAAVTQAITALARSLNIDVVAEGVETLAQLEYLRTHHCDIVQGHHLGAAVPVEQFSVQDFPFDQALLPLDVFERDGSKAQGQDRRG